MLAQQTQGESHPLATYLSSEAGRMGGGGADISHAPLNRGS